MRIQILLAAIIVICPACTSERESKENEDSNQGESTTETVGTTDSERYFSVKPNTGAFPYPSEFAVVESESREDFDWQRYVNEAQSDADRAFRANLSASELAYSINGGGHSAMDEMIRYNLAAEEYEAKCADLIRRYRAKLEEDPQNLAAINEYASHRQEAISLHVQLVGGSWGGSGRRVAFPQARMMAFINYYNDLVAIGGSLYLQDLPK